MERRSIARFVLIAVLAGALGVVGCATQKTSAPAPKTGSEWSEAPAPKMDEAKPAQPMKVDLRTIYFDFDRSEIRADAQSILRANAKAILGMSGTVTIEGNCDERGSAEYNLALGERRANAAKRYLVDLGVPSARLQTVSFGEERPAVQGHDESAWRYNRRDDFKASR
jgi:peptidoglycan-associated lipoprotein